MNFVGINIQEALPIIEGQRRFGIRVGFAARGTVKDHVCHVFAAKALGALVTQNPLDSIHDVALATSVGSDHASDAIRKFKDGPVGKTLKAEQFQ